MFFVKLQECFVDYKNFTDFTDFLLADNEWIFNWPPISPTKTTIDCPNLQSNWSTCIVGEKHISSSEATCNKGQR